MPYWIEEGGQPENGFKTTFTFKVKEADLLSKIREEIQPEHINERILLFLRYITEIKIIDKEKEFERTIIKKPDEETEVTKEEKYHIVNIIQNIIAPNSDNEVVTTTQPTKWLLFRKTFSVQEEVSQDYTTIDWERGSIKKREVVIAFKLSDENKLQKEEKGTAHIGVFSFLPLKEIESGLKFLIHADFLTTPGRSELARECKWNEWLADCCKELIINECIDSFKKHKFWKYNYTNILNGNYGGHELFKKRIIDPIEKYLSSNLLLVAEDGKLLPPEKLVKIPSTIRNLFTKGDLKLIFPEKKVVHNECEFIDNDKLKKIDGDLRKFLETHEFKDLIESKCEQKNIKWFITLYQQITETYTDNYFYNKYKHYNKEQDDFWNRLRDLSTPIIITELNTLSKISECFANTVKLQIPKELKNKPPIIHPKVYSDDIFKKLLGKLNTNGKNVIDELTERELTERIFKEELESLSEQKWTKYPEVEKINKIQTLKSFYTNKLVSRDDLDKLKSEVTLKTKCGKWLKPVEIILGAEFTDSHNLEAIINRNLYDKDTLFFISQDYLDSNEFKEKKEWEKFLLELGVNSVLEGDDNKKDKNQIPERIAVLATLEYERKNGRIPKEHTGSQKKEGWDINSGNRKIEVKGRRADSFDLLLSSNEQKALFKEDNYFIYIVSNALSEPTLKVIDGKKLREREDKDGIKFIYTFGVWNDMDVAKIDEHKFLEKENTTAHHQNSIKETL